MIIAYFVQLYGFHLNYVDNPELKYVYYNNNDRI
jgi:hypothetical protein